jgi:histidyl-tRNA synthetase
MKTVIQPVKGTRDFYPEEMAIRTWLYNKIRRVSESFGYQEYEAPLLETIELYAAKSGEELVKEQAFVFPDRGGDLLTLRPELTPSLARMVAQRQKQLVYPLRWWSFGPFWRYERPQKGRAREFFQWNIDLIGVDTPEADAELIAAAASFFQQTGLSPSQVQILVNNRQLMNGEFEKMGIPQSQRADVLRLIDRRDKMRVDEWNSYAQDIGLSNIQIDAIKETLANEALWQKSDDMRRLFIALDALGVMPYVRYAPQIVRGLDYYTGTVFEAWDVEGEFRAMFGGGRYDNLVSAVGGDPLPAVGFAMGDVVISLVLKKYGLIPAGLESSPAPVLVTIFDESMLPASISLASELRQAGINVNCYPEPAKLAKQFKFADRIGIKIAVVIGPDEVKSGEVTIKEMAAGSQISCMRDKVVDTLRSILNQPRVHEIT